MAVFLGSCLCGAVRLHAEAEPIFSGVCHCNNCQKHTGSAFSCEVAVPKASLFLTGETREFRHRGDSGKELVTTFCPVCATRMCIEMHAMPGVAMIPIGTLEDRSFFDGKLHIFCDRAQPWVPFPEGATTFAKAPPKGG